MTYKPTLSGSPPPPQSTTTTGTVFPHLCVPGADHLLHELPVLDCGRQHKLQLLVRALARHGRRRVRAVDVLHHQAALLVVPDEHLGIAHLVHTCAKHGVRKLFLAWLALCPYMRQGSLAWRLRCGVFGMACTNACAHADGQPHRWPIGWLASWTSGWVGGLIET
eukprot:365632-Chlamydomonas_euryale.AAC.18